MSLPVPSFDAWVLYCFTDGYPDFFESADDVERRAAPYVDLDVPILRGYLLRLFRDPAWLMREFSHRELANGVQFIFGVASLYLGSVSDRLREEEARIEMREAIETTYVELFDRACSQEPGRLEASEKGSLPLDEAVFMLWDMGQLEHHLPGSHNEILLRSILARCRTDACRYSALHGLGHFFHMASSGHSHEAARRIIDEFIEREDPHEKLLEYAQRARVGAVQ